MRLKQWIKNLLIFVSMFTSSSFSYDIFFPLLYIFVSFSLVVSSTYIFNDFIDIEFDHVLTVCDSAEETCPVFPNAKNRIHNSFVDPSRATYESDDYALEVYKNTVKEISIWIDNLKL